jgi:DoxX-like family
VSVLAVTALVFTLVTLAYNTFSAILDFIRYPRILDQMTRAGVPHSWLPWLGVVKLAGVVGLLVGFAVPALGVAAAAGLALFYACAVGVHLRARDYTFGLQYPFLAVALATLALQIAAD